MKKKSKSYNNLSELMCDRSKAQLLTTATCVLYEVAWHEPVTNMASLSYICTQLPGAGQRRIWRSSRQQILALASALPTTVDFLLPSGLAPRLPRPAVSLHRLESDSSMNCFLFGSLNVEPNIGHRDGPH